MYHSKQIKLGNITTSETELRDLIKAWLAISLAFAIVFRGELYYNFILSSLTVGIGFIFHELAHKFTAQHFGCFAEFRAFNMMLLLAIIMSFFGFVIAAPGAVMISGPVGRRRNGKISMAGPLANIILALLFFSLLFVELPVFFKPFVFIGFYVNAFIGLFNMLPIGNFDGRKILDWNKEVYGIMVAVSLFLVFFGYRLFTGVS